jgi:putative intracellular protease/amidase
MLIDLVVYDGVDEMDVVGPLEVFRSAATAGTEVTARLVTRVPQPIVTGAFGLGFQPDAVYQAGADVLLRGLTTDAAAPHPLVDASCATYAAHICRGLGPTMSSRNMLSQSAQPRITRREVSVG